MTFDIKNKNVLITGANRGIGKAILEEAISRRAAKVYAAVRDLDSASSLVEKYGDRVVPIRVDLDDSASIKSAAEKASDVDVVVNNAGVMKIAAAMSDDAIEALQFEMNVNVYGLMRMAHAFAPTLKSNGGGAFVQLNSVASVKTFSDFATYCASKAASYAITQGLRDSLRDQGTHVLSVHPGPIQTDMGDAAGFGDSAGSPVDVAKAIFDGIVSGNFHAWPDEVAQQVGNAYQSFAENVVEADMQESVA
ncbi:NAD(P)-dependent dehydrogenase (short-subunit alcohol dehydrogenase family) [Rhodopirellula rubra]|uniref:NAD(P)-dependent dehydrogenase (Short-subunit alcohol dehydrogenase family) n=1 Tax=Aporhodopirellula rubra TaxID=980271 RepID=A0A7W5DU14_9BACT|nr:SDR family oxidoreductase [Aporhodopirellula rubra]MBB3204365.1 NAD(P)-dependent dehydrogenase (short-subunit alcohol dehydrogenase family) [Aporhodopirellula rubra]